MVTLSLVADEAEVVVRPEEGDRIYKIVLEALRQLQICREIRPEIQKFTSKNHLCTAASEFRAVRLAPSMPCWAPLQCGAESSNENKSFFIHNLHIYTANGAIGLTLEGRITTI